MSTTTSHQNSNDQNHKTKYDTLRKEANINAKNSSGSTYNSYFSEKNNDTNTKNSSSRHKDRVAHHRHVYDLSSNNNDNSRAQKPTLKTTSPSNNNNINTNKPLPKDIHYFYYKDLIKQFEKLKLKSEHFADKDPEFANKLINFAKKISQYSNPKPNTPISFKMDGVYYPNNFYQQQSSVYSTHSSFNHPQSNIYSTFNANNLFQHANGHYYQHYSPQHLNQSNNYSHHKPHGYQVPSPPKNPPPPPPSRPPPIPPHSQQNRHYTASNSNQGKQYSDSNSANSANSRSQRNARYNPQFNSHYTQPSQAPGNQTPQPGFNQNIYSQYYNYNYTHSHNEKPYSYSYSYHTQNGPEDMLLILENPYDKNKITVQMTRTQMGPNGEQQRVTVERDFKGEAELNKFLKEFEQNLNKTSTTKPTKSSSYMNKKRSAGNQSEDFIKSPGVVVVEEPGEEPKLYRQDTGELVSDGVFVDPFLKAENNEYPNDLPKEKEKAKYPSSNPTKLYKDIDDLVDKMKEKAQNKSKPSGDNRANESVPGSAENPTKETHTQQINKNIKRTESFLSPKPSSVNNKMDRDLTKQRYRSSSVKSSLRPNKYQSLNEKELMKKSLPNPLNSEKKPAPRQVVITIAPPKIPITSTAKNQENRNFSSPKDLIKEKSKIRVINMHKNSSCKRTASMSESSKPKPELLKENDAQKNISSFEPSANFKHKFDKPLSANAKLGGEGSTLKRHNSLLHQKTYLPKPDTLREKNSSAPLTRENVELNDKIRKNEIKSRFSLRESKTTRDSATANRRYSQIYEKKNDSESEISTIAEEDKKVDDAEIKIRSKVLQEKKQKLIKNHRLNMSKKISISVDTGLSENKLNLDSKKSKLNEKNNETKKTENKNQSNEEHGYCVDKDLIDFEDDTDDGLYADEANYKQYYPENSSCSNKNASNYDIYNCDQNLYSKTNPYGNVYYRSQPSPAFFQPSYLPRSTINKSKQSPDVYQYHHQHTQNCYQHPSYRQTGHYASWYGSEPSLQLSQRNDHRQSLYFN